MFLRVPCILPFALSPLTNARPLRKIHTVRGQKDAVYSLAVVGGYESNLDFAVVKLLIKSLLYTNKLFMAKAIRRFLI